MYFIFIFYKWPRWLKHIGQPRARHGPRTGSGPRPDFVRPARCSLTPSQSLNGATNQLDIFPFAANPNWLRIGHTAAGGHVQVIKMFLLPHRLWMPLLILLFLLRHVSITHLCTEKPIFVWSFIYMYDIIWPPAPFKSCYLARHLKEVARAWCRAY